VVLQHLSNNYVGVRIGGMSGGAVDEPGLREPAPHGLRLVQAFVNTNDIEEGRDELDGPDGLREWLASRGLIEPEVEVRDRDLARALALREAIRALAAANNGIRPEPEVIDTLDRIADGGAMRVRFTREGGTHLEPSPPVWAGPWPGSWPTCIDPWSRGPGPG
jgi:hypothetical protein